MSVVRKLSFTILLALMNNSNARSENFFGIHLINSIQYFGKRYDSSCVVLLNTEDHLIHEVNEIHWIIYNLARELNNFRVTTMSFGHFLRKYKKWKKMKCNSPLLVVTHSDNETRIEMEKVSRSRMFHNTYWLMFMNDRSLINDFFENIRTPFDLRLVVAETKCENCIVFFEVYRVLGNTPLRTPQLGIWNNETGFELGTRNLYDRRYNMEGVILKTGSTDNYPMHYSVVHPDGRSELKGYFAEVWKELERILNFTSVHFVDKATGIPEENGKWNGLIGMLQRREIDVAVSNFIMDEQRSHAIDFTRPLLRTSYQIFFKNMGNNFHWDAILRPFKKEIWFTIAGWIIVSSFFSWICNKYAHNYGLEKSSKKDDFNLINSGLFFTKALCNQGHYCTPSAIASRIVFLTAYLAAGVLVPSYSAALIYFLTSRSPVRPFDSLRGLLQSRTYRLQMVAKTAHYTYFSSSTNPLLKKVYNDIIKKIPENELPRSVSEAIEKLCTERNLAYFGDTANAVFYVNKINARGHCKIMHLNREISSIYACLALTRDSPFKLVFNHYLHKLIDLGIVDEIERKTLPEKKFGKELKTWGIIEGKDVFQAFVILAMGMILSLFVFIIEILHAKLTMCIKENKRITPMFHLRRKIDLSTYNKKFQNYHNYY